ncbi:MAG: HAMP domain-containing histidine kinase [Deferribacterales bacterium]
MEKIEFKDNILDLYKIDKIFDLIINNESVDKVLFEALNIIIEEGISEKVGLFLLNEQLLKLRGVAYIWRDNKGAHFDNLKIKNCYINLKDKGKITDMLFYGQVGFSHFNELNQRKLEMFFDDKFTILGVYNNRGAEGALLLDNLLQNERDLGILRFISKLIAMALEYSKTIKQLKMAQEDISYFKESIDVSDNFTQMGKITAAVAHEIRNPLVSIGGFAKRLEKYIDNDKGKGYLKIIQDETGRLERIVSDILTYSKIFVIKKDIVRICDILEEIKNIFHDRLEELKIILDIDCDNDIEINVDVKRIKQVFINLINNAIQSIERDGKIFIEVKRGGEGVNIEIRDTGGGFPLDVLQNAFQPFYTTKEQGTGLGLSICHKIIVAHNGKISIDNYEDGASIKIYIPY